MTLDLRSVPVQVVVGGLDLSPAFVSLSLGAGTWNDSGWFKPRGQLELAAYWGGAPESFDCRVNPARWAPGTVVAISVDLGSGWVALPWRLRILSYPNRPYPGQTSITVELGGDADLLNYRAPEGDPGTDEYGTATGATTLINRALARAGAPSLADTITTLSLPFSPEKNTGNSWMTYAGQVAYAARNVLWQQADGSVRATPLTLSNLTPVASYIVGQNEADYVPEMASEQPPEVVKVHGTTYRIEVATPENTVVEETINVVPQRTILTYNNWNGPTPSMTEEIQLPMQLEFEEGTPIILMGESAEGAPLRTYKKTTVTYFYDSFSRLTRELTSIEMPRGLFPFPMGSGVNAFTLVESSRTTVDFQFVQIRGAGASVAAVTEPMVRRITTEMELTYEQERNPQILLRTRLITTESWDKITDEWYRLNVNSVDNSENPTRLNPLPTNITFSPPPTTTFRPAAKQRTERQFTGQARFSSIAGSGFAEKLWSIQLPSGMCVSSSQCRSHAQLWGRIRQGRQFGIKWAADLIPQWLTNFSPVQRVDFTVNGTTTAYLVEAFNLVIDKRSAAVGGRGIEIGIVGATPQVIDPPYYFVPEADLTAHVGGVTMAAAVTVVQPSTDLSFLATVGPVTMATSVAPVVGVFHDAAVGGVTMAAEVTENTVVIHDAVVGGVTMAAEGDPIVGVEAEATVGAVTMAANIGGSSTLLNNLVAWYSLNETSGNRADSHTGGYTLTQSGTVGSTTGKVGNAANWATASVDNRLISSDAAFNFGDTTFTIAGWLNVAVSPCNIISRWGFLNINERSYLLQHNGGNLRFLVSPDGVTNTPVAVANSLNTPNFFVVYHDAVENQIGISLNNGSFVTQSYSAGIFSGGTTPLHMGGLPTAAVENFRGWLDEVAFWSRRLTAQEITDLYNSGNGIAYPG